MNADQLLTAIRLALRGLFDIHQEISCGMRGTKVEGKVRTMPSILLVEDDRHLCDIIMDLLKLNGHEVEVVNDGLEGLELLRANPYDLIILDWNLPRLDGVSICKEFRDSGGKTPILLLTARKDTHEKEKGFYSGADDYLTKPFDARELYMRVCALLRRAGIQVNAKSELAGISLDTECSQAVRGGERISLSQQESMLLQFFMRNPDQPFDLLQLLEELWPADRELAPEDVAAFISTLRRKLREPSPIERTESGSYRFVS
jgi:OmpR-family two-component system manganese-sensing response regulator